MSGNHEKKQFHLTVEVSLQGESFKRMLSSSPSLLPVEYSE